MAGFYDELLREGGYTLPDWAIGQGFTPTDSRSFSSDGSETTGNSFINSIWNVDLTRLPGFAQSGVAARPNEGGTPDLDATGLHNWLTSQGLRLRETSRPGGVLRWIEDDQGNVVFGDPVETSTDDSQFWTAAMLGMGLTGANMAAAGFTAAGAPGSQATPTPMAPPSAPPGATSYPVTPQPPYNPTPLTPTGFEPAAMPALPNVPAGPSATPLGGAPSGVSSMLDPVAEYLRTGAAELSTLGNSLTGAGGASGAVGQGSTASWLQNLARGASSMLGGQSNQSGLRSLFDIASGIYGMRLARDAREASDPFAPFRRGYAEQLMQLEANPGMIVNRPGFKAGLEAIQRNNAARGYAGSGNETAVLSRYGGEFFNNELNRLATLAGAGQTPGAGQFPAAQLTSQSLASIGYGLAPYLSGGPR